MSYDAWLEADLGGPEPVGIGSLDANYTWNVYPMFALAGLGSPNDLDKMRAGDAAAKVRAALSKMVADPAPYRALEPANGWGNYEGACNFLLRIAKECERAPNATLRVG